MSFTDMPVPIDSRVVGCLRVIEVHGAHILQSDSPFDYGNRRFQAISFTNVIARSEGMRGIDADAERQLRTRFHDRAQMFEAMADALALTGSVLEQDSKLTETQTLAGELQAERANLQRILFGTTARTAGMHDEIVNAERDRPLDFLAKRINRLEENDFVSCRQVDQIIRVNENRR